VLSDEEIDASAQTYLDQAMVVLDPERTEVRKNGEWLSKLTYAEVVRLARTLTVARLLERDDFAKRMAAQAPISVSELLYPLMQAYDSVAVHADVELGGTDQLYNLLAGRDVMEAYGLEPQVVLTTPLLVSWDGKKMSSSEGNNIPLTMAPEEQFGRAMRIPDELLPDWYRLVLEREPPGGDPMEAKLELARFIVRRSHGEEGAKRGEDHFTRVVREGGAPEEADIPVASIDGGDVYLPQLLSDQFGQSNSHWRRMIEQGGVKLDGEPIREIELAAERLRGSLIQAGKRQFLKVSG
jgi:tyrosyl-tRNA synthetase